MIDEYFKKIADGKHAKAIDFHSDRNVIETVGYKKRIHISYLRSDMRRQQILSELEIMILLN